MLKGSIAVLFVGLVIWGYQATQPPPPKICGTEGGPPITVPRVKLRDGRHLAYEEQGVPKENAKHRIILVHAYGSWRQDWMLMLTNIQDIVEELGLYFVLIDRPGYGESDPDPKRTPKSIALDIEEVADHLGLGPKFYVMGLSMGGQVVWCCLKYIPHRLAGATLIAPAVNYWWSGLPSNLSTEAYYRMLQRDQWALRVTRYTPWLTYWWNTQKWFPPSTLVTGHPRMYSRQDLELVSTIPDEKRATALSLAIGQGEFESLHRDLNIGFGKWDFDPTDLENPFPKNEGSVHVWQGDEDPLVPVSLQRHIAQRLPWINYHEIPAAGHLFAFFPKITKAIIQAAWLEEK